MLTRAFDAYFEKEKNDVFAEVVRPQINLVRKSQIQKSQKLGPKIAKLQIVTFAEGPLT